MLCKNSKTGCTKLKTNVSYTVGKEIECRFRKYRGLLCWHFVFMWKNDVITKKTADFYKSNFENEKMAHKEKRVFHNKHHSWYDMIWYDSGIWQTWPPTRRPKNKEKRGEKKQRPV